MKRFESPILWGILLIAGGILFLLQNLGLLVVGSLFWLFLFGAAGLVFLSVFLTDYRANWWAAIPGFFLLGLAATIGLNQLAPQVNAAWGGALFMGAIGLAFGAVYFANREHWWAIIPGGACLTIALVAGLSSLPLWGGFEVGGVFFLGLGLTFGLLSRAPTPEGRMRWAFIPAAVLLVMGLVITAAATAILNYIWPIGLILGGLWLLFRAFASR